VVVIADRVGGAILGVQVVAMGEGPSAARPGIVVMVRVLTRAVDAAVRGHDRQPRPHRYSTGPVPAHFVKPTVPRQLPVQDSTAVREGRHADPTSADGQMRAC